MKNEAALLIIILAAFVSGCTLMADVTNRIAGIGVITEDKSTYDDATIIKVSPNWLYDPQSGADRVKLGAGWDSNAPDFVALTLEYSSSIHGADAYVSLDSLKVSIDGNTKSYDAGQTKFGSSAYNSVSRTIYTESKSALVVPITVLEDMVTAKDCRIRVYTSEGYEDAIFSIERMPAGQGTAVLSLRKFLDRVEAS